MQHLRVVWAVSWLRVPSQGEGPGRRPLWRGLSRGRWSHVASCPVPCQGRAGRAFLAPGLCWVWGRGRLKALSPLYPFVAQQLRPTMTQGSWVWVCVCLWKACWEQPGLLLPPCAYCRDPWPWRKVGHGEGVRWGSSEMGPGCAGCCPAESAGLGLVLVGPRQSLAEEVWAWAARVPPRA